MIGNAQPVIPPQQLWQIKYPAIISSLLSFVQFIVTIVIIGCEVGSMLIDIVTATIYVGLWASLFFMIAWISQSASACCCRRRACATYTLIIQLISMFFAICVIGFDVFYLIAPSTCFFSAYLCNGSAPVRGLFYSDANFNNIKIPLIKGQLAAGCVMLVLCLIYIVIYIVTMVRVSRAKQPNSIYPQMQNPSTISTGILTAPPVASYAEQIPAYSQPVSSYPPAVLSYPTPATSYYTPTTLNNGEKRGTELICPTCQTVMSMTAMKRPAM